MSAVYLIVFQDPYIYDYMECPRRSLLFFLLIYHKYIADGEFFSSFFFFLPIIAMYQESSIYIYMVKVHVQPKFSNFFSQLSNSTKKKCMCVCLLTRMGADKLDEEQKQTPTQESVTVQVSHTHVTLTKRPNSQPKWESISKKRRIQPPSASNLRSALKSSLGLQTGSKW